ncbi:flippase [candidate division KSB1 bacterium]
MENAFQILPIGKMVNYANRVLKGTIYIFLISLLAALLGYFVRIVLAKGLTKEEYGLFYAVFSLVALVGIFKNLGLSQALAKFIPEYLSKKDFSGIKSSIVLTFLVQFGITTVISIILFLLSDSLSMFLFHTETASSVLKLLILMFWLMPLENVFRFSFQGFQKMLLYASVELIRMLFVLILILIFIWKGFGVMAPSLSYVFVYLIVPVVCFPFFLRIFPRFFKEKLNINKELLRKLLKFGIPVMAGIFGAIIMLYTDTVILSYFGTLEDVALYQAASPTARILLYLGYALAAVFLPLSAELWAKGKKEKLRQGIQILYKFSFILVIPMALAMLVFPDLILKLLFGKEYIGAAIVLQILSIGTVFYTVGHINSNILSGIGHPAENTRIVLSAALFNLVLNLILIPFYGILGAALATLISWAIILVFTSLKIKKYVGAHAPWWGWAKNLTAGVVFVVVISVIKRLLEMSVLAEVIISLGLASLAYAGLLLALGLVTKNDLSFVSYATGIQKLSKKQILRMFK